MSKERLSEPSIWVVARRFPDAKVATRAWEQVRDLLLAENLDASVLRFTLDGQSHLALLGELPMPRAANEKVTAVIETGSEAAVLPDSISQRLRARRREFKNLGFDYLERRTGGNP